MIEKLAKDSGDSLWREIGEDAIKKAVSTFVGEGVKAVIDVWKDQYMKRLEREEEEREKARRADAGDNGEEEVTDSEEDKDEEEKEAELFGYEW